MSGSGGWHASLLGTFNDGSPSAKEWSTQQQKCQFGFRRHKCVSYGPLSLATVPLGKGGLKQR